MHALLCRLHSSFGGFGSSSVSSGFGGICSGVNSSRHCSRSSGGVSRCSSRCGFGRCWCSSRCWRLDRSFFFFAASGQSNGSQQTGDQEGLFHVKFQWMCTKLSKTLELTKEKPEHGFESGQFSLTPICRCVSRLDADHTPEKTTVFTLIKYFISNRFLLLKYNFRVACYKPKVVIGRAGLASFHQRSMR